MHVKDASFIVREGRKTTNMNFNFSDHWKDLSWIW